MTFENQPYSARLSEFYRSVRHDIVRIDIVTDDQTGMDYFDELSMTDPRTGEYRRLVLDPAIRRRFHEAVGREFVTRLSALCPCAEVNVTHGPEFHIHFTCESSIADTNDEIWAALDAVDDDWCAELWGAAFDAVLDEPDVPPAALFGPVCAGRRMPRRPTGRRGWRRLPGARRCLTPRTR
jgi:hypothetical protein